MRTACLWLRDTDGLDFEMLTDLTAVDYLYIGKQPRFEVVYHFYSLSKNHRLRRYCPDQADGDLPPVVLVPPLMLTSEVWDVAPETSTVRALREQGLDPWVVDFGAPELQEGGLERDLADHVIAVSEAVGEVRRQTGRDVHLLGYSQGGMFAYQAAALRRSESIRSLVTFGAPVDFHGALLELVPSKAILDLAQTLGDLDASFLPAAIPGWVSASNAARRAVIGRRLSSTGA